jgi:hypothetical protein
VIPYDWKERAKVIGTIYIKPLAFQLPQKRIVQEKKRF